MTNENTQHTASKLRNRSLWQNLARKHPPPRQRSEQTTPGGVRRTAPGIRFSDNKHIPRHDRP